MELIWPDLAQTLGIFLAVGFLAQLVDGALGMAYGVISSSVLLAFGVPFGCWYWGSARKQLTGTPVKEEAQDKQAD